MVKDHSDNETGTRGRHFMGCSFQLAENVTFTYLSRSEAVAGTNNVSGSTMSDRSNDHCTMSERFTIGKT